MSSAPPLSVIVLNHDGAAHLPACLESIWSQRQVAPELVVVDGGSTDASRHWLEAHRERITRLEFLPEFSRPALVNAGVAAATGEWVLFLRPQDRLVGDLILSECLNWMRKTEAGVVAGETACNDGRILKLQSQPDALARDFLPESATFYRRTLFAENSEWDPHLPTMAAYDFHLRLWKGRVRFKPIPLRVVARDQRAARFTWASAREEIRVRHRYFSTGRSVTADLSSVLRSVFRRS
jgi:glycosyltransferase involved in cell wall biosynthesis